MVKIVEGLSKAQVKQVVKIAKDKSLEIRKPLQGLIYEAEMKTGQRKLTGS